MSATSLQRASVGRTPTLVTQSRLVYTNNTAVTALGKMLMAAYLTLIPSSSLGKLVCLRFL